VAAEERSTEREERARDHVLAFVVSLLTLPFFSARHNVGTYALCLLALSILSSRLRRSHDAFTQACGSRPPRVPRPLPAPAPTEPARARAACAEARSRTVEIQVGRGDTGSAYVCISTRAASTKSLSSSCVPPIRREQS
jgi:hypothetical protein